MVNSYCFVCLLFMVERRLSTIHCIEVSAVCKSGKMFFFLIREWDSALNNNNNKKKKKKKNRRPKVAHAYR